ncbi:hypothetical protein ID866_5624, partial [Astraeus odoratus]
VVREINKINERELDLGVSASWHAEFKDSAYIFIGGLSLLGPHCPNRYGEIMDINLPRDKKTGKTKGFGFLMYEDQRSTVLAVDNLNGAKVLDRTLRVDHVKHYKQPKVQNEDGEWVDAEEQTLNAKPEMIMNDAPETDSDVSSTFSIDPEDPMRDYLIEQRREMKAMKKKQKKTKKEKRKDETPEERRARKERKRERRRQKDQKKSEGMKGVEELLKKFDGREGRRLQEKEASYEDHYRHRGSRDPSSERDRRRSPSPLYRRRRDYSHSPMPAKDSRDVRMRTDSPDRDARTSRPSKSSYDGDRDNISRAKRPRSRGYGDRD